MPIPQHDLAGALQRVKAGAKNDIVRGAEISRADRVVLIKRGFLVEIIKGWYVLTTPQAETGDTTFWHGSFWNFAGTYLNHRFGERYCLSAEHSLDLWTGNTQTPSQLIVITGKGGASTIQLPNRTSLLIYVDRKNLPKDAESRQGVRVMPLALALARVSPAAFRNAPANLEIALRLVRVDELARVLLGNAASLAAAGRLVGAFRHCGLIEHADRLAADLDAAGLEFEETDPFDAPPRLPAGILFSSPHVGRIKAMWRQMSPVVQKLIPRAPKPQKPEAYLKRVNEIYRHDAYHSLSIEGYQVTPELIARIAAGEWNPELNTTDQAQVNALAAKGYHAAFQAVTGSLKKILNNKHVGASLATPAIGEPAPKSGSNRASQATPLRSQPAPAIIQRDLPDWYRGLFSPSVQAGLLPAYALAGYRNRPVYIRGSEHIPPPSEAVPELIDTLFELLATEASPWAQAVLGHFFFVYIHPYSDGNGRIGRFILNALLASGGYPWTVIRVEHRKAYMDALEKASVRHDIGDFTRFVAAEMAASAKLKS